MCLRVVCMVVIFSVLGGCVTAPLSPEQEVKALAEEKLNALLAQDFKKAYQYLTPNYRKAISLERYAMSVAGSHMWEGGHVRNINCDEDVCDVELMIEYHLPVANVKNKLVVDERWIRINNRWWSYQK